MVEKLYSPDGDKVAIVYSFGYGAGWSTWNSKYEEAMIFDPDMATAILAKVSTEELLSIAKEKYPNAYLGGVSSVEMTVEWLPKGTPFYIHEYDGSESIKTGDSLVYTA